MPLFQEKVEIGRLSVLTKTQNEPKQDETSQNEPKPAETTQNYPKRLQKTANNPKCQNWGNLEFSNSFCFSSFKPKCSNLGILDQEVPTF